MATTVTMPSLGESVAEGEIGKWLVSEGQRVDKDDPLVEVLTDKADSEVPAPEGGVVTRIHAQVGAMVTVGDALCEIDPAAEASAGQPGDGDGDGREAEAPGRSGANGGGGGRPETPTPAAVAAPSTSAGSATAAGIDEAQASPAVRKLARERGVDLGRIDGTGGHGRITKDDVERAASDGADGGDGNRGAAPRPASPPPAAPAERSEPRRDARPAAGVPAGPGGAVSIPTGAFRLPSYEPREGDEVVPFSRRRRIIADHMVYSKLTSPHVVTFAECDLDRTAKLRDVHKGAFKKAGLGLTYLAFVVAATARALREFRSMNARVLDDAYVIHGEVNVGIAVDTPEGLVVPVLRHADELSIRGIARGIDELAGRARDGDLTPDDLAAKTFTVSNPGRKGNLVGGAIISQPNVGILRIGEIKKRVVVVEKDGEDLMAIHPVMYMALSYDHRIVDGVEANGFLWRVSEILETADFEV